MGGNPRFELSPLAEAAFYSTLRASAITGTAQGSQSTRFITASCVESSHDACRPKLNSWDGKLTSFCFAECPHPQLGRRREAYQAIELKPLCVEIGRCGKNPHHFITRTFEEDLSDDV